MVNLSSVERLIQFIDNNNLKVMRKWSTRFCSKSNTSGSFWLMLKKKIRSILNLLSGNDIVEMLKSMLQKKISYLNKKKLKKSFLLNFLYFKGVLYKKEREELSLESKLIIALKNLVIFFF